MDGVDERPLAVRRKRRSSTKPVDVVAPESNSNLSCDALPGDHDPCKQPKTPSKRNKRLRFSDPVVQTVAESSTGLTPSLKRTKLVPEKSVKKASKRLSLPSQLDPSTSSHSPLESCKEIQFTPIRQAIDSRMKRRLKRNHMGEEINEIYADKRKSKLGLQRQIEELRKELALAKGQGNVASDDPETLSEGRARITELESGLGRLKEEMRAQHTVIEPSTAKAMEKSSDAPSPSAVELADLQDDSPILDCVAQPAIREQSLKLPVSTLDSTEASTQASLPSPDFADVFRSARLRLEHLLPGENAIGLEVSDPETFLGTVISHLRKLKSEVSKTEDLVSVSETTRANMERHFKHSLSQLERIQDRLKSLRVEVAKVKDRASNAEFEASTLEARLEQTDEKRCEITKQRDEYVVALERLKPAYEYYEKECEKLTNTIIDLEDSQKMKLADLRDEISTAHDSELLANELIYEEVKSDLEARIAAEKLGRKKAEESAVDRLARIKQLENQQKELQTAINEKQAIIRTLDDDLKKTQTSNENEVGQLNVRIGQLTSEIASTKDELTTVHQESTRLATLLDQEKAAGIKAVENMQIEMLKCTEKTNKVGYEYTEGVKQREGVAQSFGLMTPVVEGGRFRDAEADEKVEGHVEMMRGKGGKKRPDSGVEIWGMVDIDEEEEGDDVVMAG
ncbi:MAG: hypothetical protein Q9183_003291 [Haloplaca sp. 2 TL-2023]